jgi:hypothetical protein
VLLSVGQTATYRQGDGTSCRATVISIDGSVDPPSYGVRFSQGGVVRERETEAGRLRPAELNGDAGSAGASGRRPRPLALPTRMGEPLPCPIGACRGVFPNSALQARQRAAALVMLAESAIIHMPHGGQTAPACAWQPHAVPEAGCYAGLAERRSFCRPEGPAGKFNAFYGMRVCFVLFPAPQGLRAGRGMTVCFVAGDWWRHCQLRNAACLPGLGALQSFSPGGQRAAHGRSSSRMPVR